LLSEAKAWDELEFRDSMKEFIFEARV